MRSRHSSAWWDGHLRRVTRWTGSGARAFACTWHIIIVGRYLSRAQNSQLAWMLDACESLKCGMWCLTCRHRRVNGRREYLFSGWQRREAAILKAIAAEETIYSMPPSIFYWWHQCIRRDIDFMRCLQVRCSHSLEVSESTHTWRSHHYIKG